MNSERDVPLTVFKPHVQIYAIVETGSDDYELIGHGFLAIITDQIENQTVNYMEVQSVKDAQVLLRSRLRLRNNYEKQRGSVIVWNDSEHKGHYDLAISFEANNECDVFWRLICEKIGKNYLEISGRDPLELPTENNLPYILDKTKTAKDLIEYNLLNSPAFTNALAQVYKKFQVRSDKMGMGMVARIIKSIFSNLDYQMVHALFKDGTFDLLLEVQKFLQDIDFPQFWAQKLRIRSIVPLSAELTQKIQIIHRLSFYRENILDLMKQNYLQHMLVMTQVQFSKQIILHLTKDTILDNLIKLTYQPTQIQPVLHSKDIGEQDTFLAENEEIKRQQFAERKHQFLLQALIISKQMQDDKGRLRFVDRVFRSGVVEMAAEDLDRGILKALDFFVCLAQSAPAKFMDYLKVKYRERPTDNLHLKLSKKYCLGSEQMQSSILEMVKYLAESFKVKQNIDFFIGTFFASVFGCCKDQKAVLGVLSDVQNMLENVQSFFGQALKSKVFERLVPFLRSQRQEKSTQLRAIKVLKRVLLQNADSSWSFKKVFLDQINQELIKSGFFQYCMMVLLKNLRFNNIISSSMLENVKIISQIKRFTPFHAYIHQQYSKSQEFAKLFAVILQTKKQQNQEMGEGDQPLSHKRALQQEQEQAYFMSEMQEEANNTAMNDQINDQLQNLRRMRREISQQERIRQESELERLSLPSKKVKSEVNEKVAVLIQLDLPFDEFEGDK